MKRLLIAPVLLIAACVVEPEPVGQASQPIIGGDPVDEETFPATGALLTALVPSCTGTLVSPSVVLTAAHCVDPELLGTPEVPSFTLQANGLAAPLPTIVSGAEARIHPQWDPYRVPEPGPQQWFDIAVLILDEPIEDVEYGVIPTTSEAQRALIPDAPVDIVGYGQAAVDDMFEFGVKKSARSAVVDVGEWEILTSSPGDPQKCFGDSGGPAYVDMAGGTRIAAVASRLPGPNEECVDGALETRVDPYTDWIADTAPEMCDELECDEESGVPLPPATGDGGCNNTGGWSQWPGMLLIIGLLVVIRRGRNGVET